MEIFVQHDGQLINTNRIGGAWSEEHKEPGSAGKFFVAATVDGSPVRLTENLPTKKRADGIVRRFGQTLDRKVSAGGGTIDWGSVEKVQIARRIY